MGPTRVLLALLALTLTAVVGQSYEDAVTVSTSIPFEQRSLEVGATLRVPCAVSGRPPPRVHWTLNGVRLVPDARTSITDAGLTVTGLTADDSGEYGCHARSEFSAHASAARVAVRAVMRAPPPDIQPTDATNPDEFTITTERGAGCHTTAFGCCPDNLKAAEGPHLEGCGCRHTQYGCCPDNVTVASGPDLEGCGCHTAGVSLAQGPGAGCLCQETEFGCCGDGKTPASGPNQAGCGACNLLMDPGPCTGYFIRWFYDSKRDLCTEFAYRGCYGNENNFLTRESCEEQCKPTKNDGVIVPINCTDNSFFANCELIVSRKVCKHQYYSRFCCESCVKAGQLDALEIAEQIKDWGESEGTYIFRNYRAKQSLSTLLVTDVNMSKRII